MEDFYQQHILLTFYNFHSKTMVRREVMYFTTNHWETVRIFIVIICYLQRKYLDGVFLFILLFCELIAASLFYECYHSRGNSTTWRGIFLNTLRAARQNTDILPCDSKGSQQFNIFLTDMDTCDYSRPFNKLYFITCKYICCIKTLMNMTVYHTWNHEFHAIDIYFLSC